MKQSSAQQKATLKKVLTCLKPYRFHVLISILLSAATVGLTLYVPVCIGKVIDLIAGKGKVDFQAIYALFLKIGIIVLLTSVLQWTASSINNKITFHVVQDIRENAFRHIQTLPLKYLDAHPTGSIVSQVISDVDQFADGLLLGFTQLFTGIVTILGTIGFMLAIQPVIALVVVLLSPLSFVAAKFIASHSYQYFKAQSEDRAAQTAFVDEMLGSQKIVKAFGREDRNVEDFDRLNQKLEGSALKAIFYSSLTNPCTRFVNSVVYAGVVLSGALLCISTAGSAAVFTVGNLSALLAYANQYTKPFNEISGVVTEFQNALACAGRIFGLMEQPSELPDADDAPAIDLAEGAVTLDRVAFSYTEDRPLIEDLSLQVKPGQRIAIVGPTGCGKTTLINLLMRFYDVKQGSIRVDGHDVRTLKRHDLRKNYGMVLQETWLRSGTIRENLTLGRPDATEEQLINACKAAHAHGFISRLPQGYDTVIQEDGGSLSQGQKQLLCIARIMLCLPPMLILDEATSSIDTRTELKIQKAFAAMMQGRTSFIVAHRLSTIREADMIIVMNNGRVIETGNHETLLDAGGFYAKLYNSQFAHE